MPQLDEITMERVMEEFERRCHDSMTHAMETEEGLGIEYDEDVVCDVCQSPDGEDNNEMVFCDKCNICVHQVRGRRSAAVKHFNDVWNVQEQNNNTLISWSLYTF